MSLEGKVALVTGAGQGIGRAIALLFARQGMGVVLNGRDLGKLEKVAKEVSALGRKALPVSTDVANPQEVEAMLKRAYGEMGRIDVLVNNAGIGGQSPFNQTKYEDWKRMLAVHVDGAFNCSRGVIGGMIANKWGRIINVSSTLGLMGGAYLVSYCTAKAGLIGFTKALAREVAAQGITVNSIAPGGVETPMLVDTFGAGGVKKLLEFYPVGRIGKPEEIAHTALFLASEEAGFITGQVICPNGGRYM